MRTGESIMGRAAALLALVFGVAYLGWRATSTIAGAPWWLGVPTLAIEAVGVLAVGITSWALWHRPQTAAPLPLGTRDSQGEARGRDGLALVSAPEPLDTEIVVRCSGQDLPALRATLISCRPIAPVLVVDLDARPEIAALAVEHGARYLATDTGDVDGLAFAANARTFARVGGG